MKDKKPLRPRLELQAHLVATRITPENTKPDTADEVRTEGAQDIMSIIEREMAKIRAEKK